MPHFFPATPKFLILQRLFEELKFPFGQFRGPNKGGFALPLTALELLFSCGEMEAKRNPGKSNHCRADPKCKGKEWGRGKRLLCAKQETPKTKKKKKPACKISSGSNKPIKWVEKKISI